MITVLARAQDTLSITAYPTPDFLIQEQQLHRKPQTNMAMAYNEIV